MRARLVLSCGRSLRSAAGRCQRLLNDAHSALAPFGPWVGIGRRPVLRCICGLPNPHRTRSSSEIDSMPQLAITSDGGKNNSQFNVIMARFVTAAFEVQELCIALSSVPRNLKSGALKGTWDNALRRIGVEWAAVHVVNGDSHGMNQAAIGKHNDEGAAFGEEDRFAWMVMQGRCFSHMINNCGKALRGHCSKADEFLKYAKKLHVSDACNGEFQDRTPGRLFIVY